MQNNTVFLKAPHLFIPVSPVLRFVKFFKYELIKLLIFLLLFIASVLFAELQSNEYYRTNITILK